MSAITVLGHEFDPTDEGYWVALDHLLDHPESAAPTWWEEG